MLQADRENFGIKDKAGKANFVTKYDCKIQKMLEKKLSEILPEAEFLGEEEDCQINRNAEYIFIISHTFQSDTDVLLSSCHSLSQPAKYLRYNPELNPDIAFP